MRPSITLLHTADLHLGAKFIGLGPRGTDQRRALRDVLSAIVRVACESRVDAVLFAGDTFDSQTPSPESLGALRQALATLHENQIPVLAIAGTHDAWISGGILARLQRELAGVWHVLTPEAPTWESPHKFFTVRGSSLTAANDPRRPLQGVRAGAKDRWQIALAHGALEMGNPQEREAVFSGAEIAATGMDYLALGHWHSLHDASSAGVTAWFAGSPELVALDQAESGSVLLVTLAEGEPVRVVPQRVGKRRVVKLSVTLESGEALLRTAKAQADPESVLELTVQGVYGAGGKPDPEEWRRSLQNDYFWVRIRDLTRLEIKPEDLNAFPEATVLGHFVREIQAELQKADPARQEDWKAVLDLGTALLTRQESALW